MPEALFLKKKFPVMTFAVWGKTGYEKAPLLFTGKERG